MDLQGVLDFIEAAEDNKTLEAIRRAVKKRQDFLLKEAARHRAAEAWNRVKCHKPGDILYCCAQGLFIGGRLQCGDKVKVHAVQPRKKLLWATLKGEKEPRHFTPSMIANYKLRQFPPGTPEGHKMMEEFAKALEGM